MKTLLPSTVLFAVISYFLINPVIANEDKLLIGNAEYKVLYQLSFQPDSLNPDRILNEDMLLLIDKNKSMFISYNSYLANTGKSNQPVIINTGGSVIIDGSSFTPSFFNYKIYKNYPEGKITYTEFFPMDYYKYEEPLNAMNWEITGDRENIGIYSAQKAITNYAGRNWEAWFTSEVPVNDGPYKFNGLPGLILRIKDSRNHFVFEIKDIAIPQEQYPLFFQKVTFINTERSKFHSFERNPVLSIQIIPDNPGAVSDFGPKFNNFLEQKVD